MKKRIRIDTGLVSALILLTGFLYLFPQLYPRSPILNSVLYFLGQLLIIKGSFLRMMARGHKKAFSKAGAGLVTTGPYVYVRNPMYLGSFLIGSGFVLVLWPWWMLPLFAILFYLRFIRQIKIEENHLRQLFGKKFEDFCQRVPRLFPKLSSVINVKLKTILVWDEIWSTKDRNSIIGWPAMAMVLRVVQEKYVFGTVFWGEIIWLPLLAGAVFAVCLWGHLKFKG